MFEPFEPWVLSVHLAIDRVTRGFQCASVCDIHHLGATAAPRRTSQLQLSQVNRRKFGGTPLLLSSQKRERETKRQ